MLLIGPNHQQDSYILYFKDDIIISCRDFDDRLLMINDRSTTHGSTMANNQQATRLEIQDRQRRACVGRWAFIPTFFMLNAATQNFSGRSYYWQSTTNYQDHRRASRCQCQVQPSAIQNPDEDRDDGTSMVYCFVIKFSVSSSTIRTTLDLTKFFSIGVDLPHVLYSSTTLNQFLKH